MGLVLNRDFTTRPLARPAMKSGKTAGSSANWTVRVREDKCLGLRSVARRCQTPFRYGAPMYPESIPRRPTPRRMKGATVVLRVIPAAKPMAAIVPLCPWCSRSRPGNRRRDYRRPRPSARDPAVESWRDRDWNGADQLRCPQAAEIIALLLPCRSGGHHVAYPRAASIPMARDCSARRWHRWDHGPCPAVGHSSIGTSPGPQ